MLSFKIVSADSVGVYNIVPITKDTFFFVKTKRRIKF